MRGKSATRSAASISSSKDVFKPNDEENTSPASAVTLPSISSKRTADMFASYSNGNGHIDFGASIESTEKMIGQDGPSSSATLADISDGAKRLAQELDQYITRAPDKAGQDGKHKGSVLSDDAIADLQLATARKLREVRQFHIC